VLLESLLPRRGELLSKRGNMAHVWDAEPDGSPNIVEVDVRRLRGE
jgi:DNA-binding response OmpR family regulator